jgi:aspartate racemase
MKKIGLIGGMSWESTLVYYKLINEKVKEKLGGFHSCNCILESVDFAEIVKLQHCGDWNQLDKIMAKAARNLENAGAEIIILCTNTMHLCSDSIRNEISIPFLHIAEATGNEIKKQNIKKVLLLGTKFTMEKDFYKNTLKEKYAIETIIPSSEDRDIVHEIIYTELVQGKIIESSKNVFQKIIQKGIDEGAKGVILGCTEIPLLIKQNDSEISVFDTTAIHAESAAAFSLNLHLQQ